MALSQTKSFPTPALGYHLFTSSPHTTSHQECVKNSAHRRNSLTLTFPKGKKPINYNYNISPTAMTEYSRLEAQMNGLRATIPDLRLI